MKRRIAICLLRLLNVDCVRQNMKIVVVFG